MDADYDVLIIGGGMVGASLACALGQQSLRIGLIEAVPFGALTQPSYDDRSIALSYGTRRIFEGIGLWSSDILPLSGQVTAIKKIHVSDKGHFGKMRMAANKDGYDALGYVVENRVLGDVLTKHLTSFHNVDYICPAKLIALETTTEQVIATIENDNNKRILTAKLVVGADGGRSIVRRLLDIDSTSWSYGQSAVIANVTPEYDHQHVAYERFTENGPLAMLPMSENRCSLVWTLPTEKIDSVLVLDDDAFLADLQTHFGQRLGRLQKVGKRSAYPLSLTRASRPVGQRVALIGNAAHTIHPIAGQGFNLGLRDVAALAQVLVEAVQSGQDPGLGLVLSQYDQWRRHDQKRIVLFTDGLVRIFSNSFNPLVVARNIGLVGLDCIPVLKKSFMQQTMGLSGKLPRLARGLPLNMS